MKYESWNKALQEYFNFSQNASAHSIKLALTIHSLAEIYEKSTGIQKDINDIENEFLTTVKNHINKHPLYRLPQDFAVLCALSYCAYLRENTKDYTDRSYLNHTQQHLNVDANHIGKWKQLFRNVCFQEPPDGFKKNWTNCRYPIFHCLLTVEQHKHLYNYANQLGLEAHSPITLNQAQQFAEHLEEQAPSLELLSAIQTAIKYWDGCTLEINENTHHKQINRELSLSRVKIELKLEGNKLDAIFFTPHGQEEPLTTENSQFQEYLDLLNSTTSPLIFVFQDRQYGFSRYKRCNFFREDDKNDGLLLLTRKQYWAYPQIHTEGRLQNCLYELEEKIPTELETYFKEEISFQGGLKLARNTWLEGAGPTIHCKNAFKIDEKEYSSDFLRHAPGGIYVVEYGNQTEKVEIACVLPNMDLPDTQFSWERSKTWQFLPGAAIYNGKNYDNSPSCILNGFQIKEQCSVAKNLQKLYINKYKEQVNEHPLIATIRREKYGR